MRKLPNPRNSTLSPLASASVMLSKMVLTMVSVSFFDLLRSQLGVRLDGLAPTLPALRTLLYVMD